MKKPLPLFCLMFVLGLSGCISRSSATTGSNKPTVDDVKVIAANIARDVGAVGTVAPGSRGAPIVLIEERHDSRAGQVESSIMLVRLHDRYRLRTIGLEGYLYESPDLEKIQRSPPMAKSSAVERARVYSRFLREGEISGVEFMKLVYDDVRIEPIETQAEYRLPSDQAGTAPVFYLYEVALEKLKSLPPARMREIITEAGKLKTGSPGEAEKRLALLFSADPWCKAKYARLREDKTFLPIEENIALLDEIKAHAEKEGVTIELGVQKGMTEYLEFLRLRLAANKTMAERTGKLADAPGQSVVAMNIGAAHTAGICQLLQTEGRPFAVVTPNSLKQGTSGDLAVDAFRRKQRSLPVVEGGINALLPGVTGHIKPVPVIQKEWFQAKSELYQFSDRIARVMLTADRKTRNSGPSTQAGGGGNSRIPPNGPGKGGPPSSPDNNGKGFFGADDFRGTWIFIDPERIQRVSNRLHPGVEEVVFPVRMGNKEIWVKVGRNKGGTAEPVDSVEAALKETLTEIHDETGAKKKPNNPNETPEERKARLAAEREGVEKAHNKAKAAAKDHQIQISFHTKMVFGSSREEVMRAQIPY